MKSIAPIRLIKAGEKTPESEKMETATSSKPIKKVDPEVQWTEVEPGVYDITFTCSCGERTVIRCQSIEEPALKKAPASTPPPAPAKTTESPAPSKSEIRSTKSETNSNT
ncbi:MAG: hypothetical protein ACOY3I_00755 [Verrucomicrobiota bacterium]